jgi:predicted ATPase/DNA-binding SARP family transcriptional activator
VVSGLGSTAALGFGLLGPLSVTRAQTPLQLGGRQQRAVLALLLVEAGGVVSTDRLVDVLWDDHVPKGAIATLHTYVSHLRDLLEPGRPRGAAGSVLLTEPTGYWLRVDGASVDAAVFEQRARSGRVMFESGRLAHASAELAEALDLWRGPVLADLADYEFARLEAARLDELRLGAIDARIEVDLLLGRHAELVAELDQLTASHPVRERLHAQRMLALYRCGRQTEALAGYHQLRESLAEELGIDPGPAIDELQRRILRHDPALDVASARTVPLPTPPNALLGRERDTEQLVDLLRREDVRLLVLTGAGGSGKTRLALEAARATAGSFANGAVFVELAAMRDPDLVLGAVSQAVGIAGGSGDPLDALAAALGDGEMLLVLDNFEQLRAAGPRLVELLARVPRVTLLVTSRVTLRVTGEHVYPVEPLAEDAAVRLFIERAREAEPRLRIGASDTRTIREICRRLDALPLAVELAASRVRMLTPIELLARLETRLPILTDGANDLPLRQRTLRATIEWSFDLLDKDERRDLCRLAVFAGGCTLSAAETVCGVTLEELGTFVDHSLLRRIVGGTGSRYSMLETIREHAAEHLNDDDTVDVLRRSHAEHFLAVAKSANLYQESEGEQRHDIVNAEQGNIRAALEWALDADDIELALNLAIALEGFWVGSAPFEGVRWFEALLPRAAEAAPLTHARALRCYGGVRMMTGAPDRGKAANEQSLAQFRALGDQAGVAALLHRLAEVAHQTGDLPRARQLAEESLDGARACGKARLEASSLGTLGSIACEEGDHGRGMKLLERSVEISREIGFWWMQGVMLGNLCEYALAMGSAHDAEAWGREAVLVLHRTGDRLNTVAGLAMLARIAAETGRLERAGQLWGAVEAEEVRAPAGWWAAAREAAAAPVLAHAGPEFEQGRAVGREWFFDEAVHHASDDQTAHAIAAKQVSRGRRPAR